MLLHLMLNNPLKNAVASDVVTATCLFVVAIVFATLGMTKNAHAHAFQKGANTFAMLFVGLCIAVSIGILAATRVESR